MHSRTTLVAAATAATAVAAGGAYAVAMVPGIAGGLHKLWMGGSGAPIPVSADIETALRGKLVLITGPTSGLGLQVARLLAAGGARMVCAVHPRAPRADLEKHCSSNIVDTIDIDLADVASIRAFVSACRKKGHGPFDVVILNAGVITGHGERTQQGIEMTVGVNFFANAVLVMELVAAGLFAPPPSTGASNESASGWTPRLVAIASEGHRLGPRLAAKDFPDREFHYATAYGQSKLFLLSFVFELHRRLRGRSLCAALCPGAMKTSLASSLPTVGKLAVFAVNRTMARTPEQVAPEVVRIASMAEPSVPWREARYFSAGREDTPRDDATDPKIDTVSAATATTIASTTTAAGVSAFGEQGFFSSDDDDGLQFSDDCSSELDPSLSFGYGSLGGFPLPFEESSMAMVGDDYDFAAACSVHARTASAEPVQSASTEDVFGLSPQMAPETVAAAAVEAARQAFLCARKKKNDRSDRRGSSMPNGDQQCWLLEQSARLGGSGSESGKCFITVHTVYVGRTKAPNRQILVVIDERVVCAIQQRVSQLDMELATAITGLERVNGHAKPSHVLVLQQQREDKHWLPVAVLDSTTLDAVGWTNEYILESMDTNATSAAKRRRRQRRGGNNTGKPAAKRSRRLIVDE